MSRRVLSTIGTVVAVLVVAGVMLWDRGGADPHPSPESTRTVTTASAAVDPTSGLPWVEVAALPPEARRTLQLIDAGGPFPFPGKDGSMFGNFEGLLPKEAQGYYAEYTVPTPGSPDRGARRIIAGDGGEYYWTADHYAHFERVRR
jgi:ribonuclease T1